MKQVVIRPQPTQEKFLSSPADIAIFGGAAGGGKSWSLLLDPLRNIHDPNFRGVIFRRTYPQIRNSGGLLDRSYQIYPLVGGRCRATTLDWIFPSGAVISFRHLKLERNIHDYQGSEFDWMGWDELTQFTEQQFWYLSSRLRSSSGIRPVIRATTNPDPDSFVRKLIDWWIGDDGYPIPSRAGVLRYFERKDEQIIWLDHPTPNSKSITFIPSRLEDNQILMQSDPGYKAWLLSLPLVDRERLLMGNWNARAEPGKVFKREWIQIVDSVPVGKEGSGWDLAVQEKQISGRDPDYTAKVRGILAEDGSFTIVDAWETHCTPAELDNLIRATAQREQGILQIFEREPGATGAAYLNHIRQMIGPIGVVPRNKDKIAHVKPLSALAERGKLKILRGPWNALLISRFTSFPDGHDDLVDAAATAYNYLAGINVATAGQGYYSY